MRERVPKRSEAARPPFEEDGVGIQQDSVPPDRGDALQEGGQEPRPARQDEQARGGDIVQSYLDEMAKHGRSKRWVNVSMHQLVSFFRANGFKKQRELELERQYLPMRYRKRPEYIPLSSEINKMNVSHTTISR